MLRLKWLFWKGTVCNIYTLTFKISNQSYFFNVLWFIFRRWQLIHTIYFRTAKMTNINWRWYGRIQLRCNRGNIPAFSWNKWGNPRKSHNKTMARLIFEYNISRIKCTALPLHQPLRYVYTSVIQKHKRRSQNNNGHNLPSVKTHHDRPMG